LNFRCHHDADQQKLPARVIGWTFARRYLCARHILWMPQEQGDERVPQPGIRRTQQIQ
jgi:hypothetical protein